MPHKQFTSQILGGDGLLHCAQCGGTQFGAHRSFGRKAAVGVLSLLGSTNEVHCLACGAKYKTGAAPASRHWTPPRPDAVG